ncbi:MAG: 6-carboxytetrahydropterin synthase [Elusimicrobia bacterium]|nr:6-carboxytetrahydropterin synthase [Elusimicrobiota bacterium]
MKHSVTRLIRFCYGHRLLHYQGKCRHLHGHNGLIEITMRSKKLDALGMVMDFDAIKSTIQRWVDSELDHKLILNAKDPLIPFLRKQAQPIFLLKSNPTAEAIAELIYRYAKSQRLPVSGVKLWETADSFAEYSQR